MRAKKRESEEGVFWLAIAAVAWAVGMAWVGGLIEVRFLRHNAFHFDPVAYLNACRALGEQVALEGRWAVAWSELRHGMMPAFTVPTILLAPDWLGKQTAHLFAAMPMLATGLFAVGWWTWRRWGSLALGLGAMALLALTPGYFTPMFGLGAFWLDHASAFPAVAAVVTLLVWMERGGSRWLVGFALLCLWTVSGRWVAAVYLLVIGTPILVAGGVRLWRRGGSRALGKDALILGGAMLVLPVPFLLSRLDERLAHYAANSFGYQGIGDSLVYAYACFFEYLHPLYALATVGLAVGLAAGSGTLGGWRGWALPFWLAQAVLLFLGLSTQIGEAGQSTFFQVPFWVLALFAVPVAEVRRSISRLWWIGKGTARLGVTMPAAVWVCALLSGALAISSGWRETAETTSAQRDRTLYYRALLANLRELPESVRVGIFYENGELEGPRLRAEAAHRLRRELHLSADLHLYHLATLWEAAYPGMSPEAVAGLYRQRVNEGVDLAIAHADPKQVSVAVPTDFHAFRNPYSEAVAQELAEYLLHSPDWEPVFTIETAAYGSLTGYRRREGQND